MHQAWPQFLHSFRRQAGQLLSGTPLGRDLLLRNRHVEPLFQGRIHTAAVQRTDVVAVAAFWRLAAELAFAVGLGEVVGDAIEAEDLLQARPGWIAVRLPGE